MAAVIGLTCEISIADVAALPLRDVGEPDVLYECKYSLILRSNSRDYSTFTIDSVYTQSINTDTSQPTAELNDFQMLC